MNEVPIILLAAGRSSRMGGADKLMQLINGEPLVRRSARIALAVGPVIAALPPAPHPRYQALNELNVITTEIANAAEGINASLRGVMALVPEQAPAVMILLADLPDLTSHDLGAVLQSRRENPQNLVWRGATEDETPGHPVIFDHALFNDLSQLTGDTGAQEVVNRCKEKVHLHRLPAQNALLDLDTPEDWINWESKRTAV